MYSLTMRQQNILDLLGKNRTLTGSEIAGTLGVSIRTVQSDILGLRELGLVKSDKRGYELFEIRQNQMKRPAHHSANMDDIKRLIHLLLVQNDSYDVDELAEEMLMSTATLKRRLCEVEEYISARGLSVEIKNNVVTICGNEVQKRKTIRHFIFQDVSPDFYTIKGCAKYFDTIDAELLCDIISEAIREEGYLVHDVYSSNLFIAIMIALYRIKRGQHTTSPDWEDLRGSCEYRIAMRLANACRRKADIEMTSSDILYITSLFYGQLRPENYEMSATELTKEFELCVYELLSRVLGYYMIAIEFSPYIKSLSLHIKDLLKRAENDNYISSRMYENIHTNLPFVYEVAIHFAKALNEHFQIYIPNDEIGFLGVHIGLLIEFSVVDSGKINVLISSSNYQNINQKLEKMFARYYEDSITLNTLPFSSESSVLDKKSDIIISTAPLDIIGKRVVNISPLLTSEDRGKIDSAIQESIKEKNLHRYYTYIHSFFDERLFFKRSDISTRDEAIRFLGGKMTEMGVCSAGYIESIMSREQLSSTRFFDSFAIPHALEMTAKQTAFAVLINDNGILWDDCRIKLCILIAVCEKDRNAFSQAYDYVVRVMCDNTRLRGLIKSANLSEFLNRLKSK